MRKTLRCFCAFEIVCVATITLAQVNSSSSVTSGIPAVSIPFFPEDSHGNPVNSVSVSDLSILDNKRPPQKLIALLPPSELPLRLGVLIDTSTSEKGSSLYLPGIKTLADFIEQTLGPEDKIFIVTVATVPNATSFMSRKEFQNYHLDLRTGGGTALWDSVVLACRDKMESEAPKPARRVLVMLSDGGDNLSHVTHDKAIEVAQQAGVVVFSVSTEENPSGNLDNRRLQEFGDWTGGHAFLHLTKKELPRIFSEIKDEIDSMYVITYVPAEASQPGKHHSLEMRLASDKKAKLRAPKGYDAPGPP